MTTCKTPSFSETIKHNLRGHHPSPQLVSDGNSGLASWFDVTGLCVSSMGAACAEIGALAGHTETRKIHLDRKLASAWFGMTLRPQGWTMPPIWDDIAGLYETKDGGWIRLHTNAPHHRNAALSVLHCEPDKAAVKRATSRWQATELETAILTAGGCAAEMRSITAWTSHPQGEAVAQEPLIAWQSFGTTPIHTDIAHAAAPLSGLKVLDCTRVLAGPVCTRFLAGFGADVLRIDPPDWSEANIVPEITLGKRTATLDLKSSDGRAQFLDLLKSADLFVHGYRADALDGLGLGPETRRQINPSLIEVCLNAYGWTGPWVHRRGYDSLVQMSSGIAHLGMIRSGNPFPTPLPVQALDHATGYLMAASAVRAVRIRQATNEIVGAKLSLARTAAMLIKTASRTLPDGLREDREADVNPAIEDTDWGPAKRLKFPTLDADLQPRWTIPARNLHQDPARWSRET